MYKKERNALMNSKTTTSEQQQQQQQIYESWWNQNKTKNPRVKASMLVQY